MRWCLDRWETRLRRVPLRVALFAAAFAAAAPAAAGPVNTNQDPAAKMEEIEKAGEKLKAKQAGAVDEALKLLQEAVKKKTDLPPARLMIARLMMDPRLQDYHKMVRGQLELAASEDPGHPEVYL